MSSPRILGLFDFDGVLADTEVLLVRYMDDVLRDYLDPDHTIPYHEFCANRERHFVTYGSSLHGWAVEHGLDADWLLAAQRFSNGRLMELIRPQLKPDSRRVAQLQVLKEKGHHLVILTNSYADVYTLPLMKHLGLDEVFAPQDIFDTVRIRGMGKQKEECYRLVYEELGYKAERQYMVEDVTRNLVVPRKLGIHTVLIHEVPSNADPACVDKHFHTIHPALDYLRDF